MCWGPSVFYAWRPFSVIVIVPGGSPRTSRPTPPGTTSLASGWIRKTSPATRSRPIPHTRPCAVPPSLTHSAPSRSHATPLAPGVPLAYSVAVGGAAASGSSTSMWSALVTYRRPSGPEARPAGLHGAARLPTTVLARSRIRNTGHGEPAGARPGAYRSPRLSAVKPSIAILAGGGKTVVQFASGRNGRGPSPSPRATEPPNPTAATAAATSPARTSMFRISLRKCDPEGRYVKRGCAVLCGTDPVAAGQPLLDQHVEPHQDEHCEQQQRRQHVDLGRHALAGGAED